MLKRQITEKHNPFFLLIVCIILAFLSIGITVALNLTSSEPKVNTFIPGNISCEVQEDYSIKNTGNTSSYIRADIIVNWMDESGNIYAINPEYTFELGTDWKQSTNDGYYYYTNEVNEAENTSKIISELITTSDAPEGYSLCINILAEAIQSGDNNKAIENAWGIDIENIN